jgi:hypothetical protein
VGKLINIMPIDHMLPNKLILIYNSIMKVIKKGVLSKRRIRQRAREMSNIITVTN